MITWGWVLGNTDTGRKTMFTTLKLKAKALSIFRQLLDDTIIQAFIEMIDGNEIDTATKIDNYANFIFLLFQSNNNFTEYVWQRIVFDENIYIRKYANKEAISSMMQKTIEHELRTLQEISQITSQDIKKDI